MTYVVVNTSKRMRLSLEINRCSSSVYKPAANLNLYQASLQHEMEVVWFQGGTHVCCQRRQCTCSQPFAVFSLLSRQDMPQSILVEGFPVSLPLPAQEAQLLVVWINDCCWEHLISISLLQVLSAKKAAGFLSLDWAAASREVLASNEKDI